MAAPRIPDWKERLKACFRYRHRLLHVFGIPGALGAVAAVAGASALNPDTGLALGALTAAIGSLLAGYYVVAGFDRSLVGKLQAEETEHEQALADGEIRQVLATSDPQLGAQLGNILHLHQQIEGVFSDGIDDAVEAILQNSRTDLTSLRNRAISMVKLFHRLTAIVLQTDGRQLQQDLERIDADLARTPEGALRDTLIATHESTTRALSQWQAASEKRSQVWSILKLIENNLHEFKLAMELRKADATMGGEAAAPEVSELQARLAAAGEACDELIGRSSVAPRARQKLRGSR
jgi:hypothetical protein